MSLQVDISIGEAIDKFSILELKAKFIKDDLKLVEINKEIKALDSCVIYKKKYAFFYKLLSYVNEEIWKNTDTIKKMTIDNTEFSKIANIIFELNQCRFRVKNWFNILTSSNIKEQKSYINTHCNITVNDEINILNKIPEINYILLQFDEVSFSTNNTSFIKNIFKNPNIVDIKRDNDVTYINLFDFSIGEHLINIFEFEPISYISGGLLGDFIHQLSVINENFYKFGRKGLLYISNNVGDAFRFGIDKAYNDTYNIISKQNYIKGYFIYNNEKYDINLSMWRESQLLYRANWYTIFKHTYSIDWGKHKWLTVDTINDWTNKIVINYSKSRMDINIDYNRLLAIYGNSLIFVGFDDSDYKLFTIKLNNIDIKYYCPKSLEELVNIISSCKLFIGGLSAPLAFAFSIHKKCIIDYHNSADSNHFIRLQDHLTCIENN
jgi:hypothetical protein